MGAMYLKQPDGKFARWSSIVDDFTHMGMTREEALAEATREVGEDAGRRKIDRAEADDMTGIGAREHDDGLDRWRDCLYMTRINHGAKAAKRREAYILDDDDDHPGPPGERKAKR